MSFKCIVGEVLRKKRREKDGHKDPFLLELGRLQESVMAQLTSLRAEHEEAEQTYEELVKVAKILGLDHKNLKSHEETKHSTHCNKSKEPRSPEKLKASSSTQVEFLMLLDCRSRSKWHYISIIYHFMRFYFDKELILMG